MHAKYPKVRNENNEFCPNGVFPLSSSPLPPKKRTSALPASPDRKQTGNNLLCPSYPESLAVFKSSLCKIGLSQQIMLQLCQASQSFSNKMITIFINTITWSPWIHASKSSHSFERCLKLLGRAETPQMIPTILLSREHCRHYLPDRLSSASATGGLPSALSLNIALRS